MECKHCGGAAEADKFREVYDEDSQVGRCLRCDLMLQVDVRGTV